MRTFLSTLVLLLGAATAAEAHLSWIRLPEGRRGLGRAATLSLDHGDLFPESAGSRTIEETPSFRGEPLLDEYVRV